MCAYAPNPNNYIFMIDLKVLKSALEQLEEERKIPKEKIIEAIEQALLMQESNDVVLILGKGDETYQEIAGVKHPFDDRVVVREILARWAKQK